MSEHRRKDNVHIVRVRGHPATRAAGAHDGCQGQLEENVVRKTPAGHGAQGVREATAKAESACITLTEPQATVDRHYWTERPYCSVHHRARVPCANGCLVQMFFFFFSHSYCYWEGHSECRSALVTLLTGLSHADSFLISHPPLQTDSVLVSPCLSIAVVQARNTP